MIAFVHNIIVYYRQQYVSNFCENEKVYLKFNCIEMREKSISLFWVAALLN